MHFKLLNQNVLNFRIKKKYWFNSYVPGLATKSLFKPLNQEFLILSQHSRFEIQKFLIHLLHTRP